ncbi:hypothetical protein BVY10_27300, partial [Pseudomonas amygdali pv. morsprunorum]
FQSFLRFFRFGPAVSLCEGANLKYFLNAMYSSFIYYDPGVNMKLVNDRWIAKKRNQFRVSWKNIESLYERVERVVLS